jgi:hypothetical protein
MEGHWHHCSWEIDQGAPTTAGSKIERRPPIKPGQVSRIDEPTDSPMWQEQGHGGYRAVSGHYEFAHVVWRCDGACPRF